MGYDPTNQIDIGDRHVLVGRGRDYYDVAPLRGVYAGPFGSKLFVNVEITRAPERVVRRWRWSTGALA